MISDFKAPTNQVFMKEYMYGQTLYSKKWYVRPLNWAGIWKREDDKVWLVSGNVEETFDTEQQCIDYINEKNDKE